MTVAQLRPLAEADLVDRARYYRREAGDVVAQRFFDAAVTALRTLEHLPRSGSPRIGQLCGIPGLRALRIAGFPVSWFYFARDGHVDVVRLLADAQDLPVMLAELDPQ